MNDAFRNTIYRYGRQQQLIPSEYPPLPPVIDRFQGKWNDHVAAAKAAWSLLNERELKRSDGNPENLKWLLQVRYTMSPRDASAQVEKFIQSCGY
jgi:hypothetical protein